MSAEKSAEAPRTPQEHMTAEAIAEAWDSLCTHGAGICWECAPKAIRAAFAARDAELLPLLMESLDAIEDLDGHLFVSHHDLMHRLRALLSEGKPGQ